MLQVISSWLAIILTFVGRQTKFGVSPLAEDKALHFIFFSYLCGR